MRSTGILLWGALLFALAACGSDQQSLVPQAEGESAQEERVAKIEGEVFYRERIMIPPDSEVEVQLEDISRADALASVMESVSFKAQGGPPYPFSIEYDPDRIDERMRYALRARITSPDGELLFTNTEYIDPFSGNPVQVMVHGMARPVEAAPETQPEAEPQAESEPEAEPEPGVGPEPAPAPEPAEPADTPATANEGAIVWVLETLRGETAPAGAGGKRVDLLMNAADSTASGFSGCNRYSGTFSNEGRSSHGTPIKFGPLAGTMMACADGGDLEQAYLQVLGRVDAYRMQGGQLELLRGDKIVATFKPR